MNAYEELLGERTDELKLHLALISELNAAAIARQGLVNLERVEREHVEILKSGFLVHLYNVVEAVMDVVLIEVAKAAVRYSPGKWSEAILSEWVRARAGVERHLEPPERLTRTMNVLRETMGEAVGVDFRIRSEGNWSDDEITKVCQRLGCALRIPHDVLNRACETPFQDNLAPMKFVRHKRNRLAHGNETFGSGASLLSPGDLERLAANSTTARPRCIKAGADHFVSYTNHRADSSANNRRATTPRSWWCGPRRSTARS